LEEAAGQTSCSGLFRSGHCEEVYSLLSAHFISILILILITIFASEHHWHLPRRVRPSER